MTIEAKDVSVRIGKRAVIEAVSLRAPPGAITVVAGPNGAGKSTLLRAMSGLLPLAHGEIRLDDVPLETFNRPALGRAVAYLPQDRTIHWPVTSAIAVGLGRIPHRIASAGESAADRAAVDAAMAAMDVTHFAARPVNELSGGERARVLIARALAQESKILIADEPAAGLDPGHALQLFAHLRRLAGAGRTIITAIHDLSLAARFADQIVLMKDGRIVTHGSPRDVLTASALAHVYGVRASLHEVDGLPVVLAADTLTGAR